MNIFLSLAGTSKVSRYIRYAEDLACWIGPAFGTQGALGPSVADSFDPRSVEDFQEGGRSLENPAILGISSTTILIGSMPSIIISFLSLPFRLPSGQN
jgi:hypothetical protein